MMARPAGFVEGGKSLVDKKDMHGRMSAPEVFDDKILPDSDHSQKVL